jgi:hypothetical protein
MERPRALLAASFALAAACSAGRYEMTVAERPLTLREMGSRDLTVTDGGGEGELTTAFAQALAGEGFKVVDRAPYRGELEVTLTTYRTRAGPVSIATVRTDGFFVEEARVPADRGEGAAIWLAKTLAMSQRMADYVRNGGVPQQSLFGR